MQPSPYCLLALVVLYGPAACGELSGADKAPNILFIMIDDLGWMDLRCQGNMAVQTNRVDQLARQGMRFTNAYAASPVCTPTRAAIMTGQAPARLHITNHTPERESFIPNDPKILPAPMHNQLRSDAVTIAERLQQAGYDTAFLGKWHLSGPGRGMAALEPTAQGFNINVGGCGYGGPPTFFDPYDIPYLPSRKKGEYLPDRLADEAIGFLKRKRETPFFLCLWNYTVHWPMEAPEELLKKYASHQGRGLNDKRYGAMIEGMDRSIGQVLDALEETGQAPNTLVVFTSDNGGFSGVADNRPLRMGKGHLYEGGIRVPLIVRWPGKIKPDAQCEVPVVSMDFYPTLLQVAGLPPEKDKPLDGVDVSPLLFGNAIPERSLYFHYPNYAFHRSNRLGGAIRIRNWKLIERFDNNQLELYDLANDLSEKRDLFQQHSQRARAMATELADWRRSVNANMPRQP